MICRWQLNQGYCQRNFKQSKSFQRARFYAKQSWHHSVRAALRVCL